MDSSELELLGEAIVYIETGNCLLVSVTTIGREWCEESPKISFE